MEKNKNYIDLKNFCFELGIGLFGVADIVAVRDTFYIAPAVREKFDKAVCLGVRLSASILEEIDTQPTRIYFHHYRATNLLLDSAAIRVSNYLQDKGSRAYPVPASQIVDWQKQQSHLSHKRLAALAGLGWRGRNNLLVNKDMGSQLRLVSILTDMPLKLDKPVKDDCGDCRACLMSCPAQAIKENPSDFDSVKCFEKLKEFQRLRIAEQFICGVCVNACRKTNTAK